MNWKLSEVEFIPDLDSDSIKLEYRITPYKVTRQDGGEDYKPICGACQGMGNYDDLPFYQECEICKGTGEREPVKFEQ